MKIVLINPPFEEEYSVGNSKSIKYVLNIIPPLGLAYLASVLEKDNFTVKVIDCTVEKYYPSILRASIDEKPSIVGITASTPVFESAKLIAGQIRDVLPEAVIVLGGAHVTAMPYEAMESGCFDVAVIGEGEMTCLELVRHIRDKGPNNLENIKGIVFKKDARFTLTPRREYIKDLDGIAYPARHLLPPLSKYKPTPASYRRLPLGVIMTSRGCPHQCTFCDRAVFGNVYRQRSAENVLGEAEEVIHKYGAKEIRFFDDCFTLDKERTYAICQGMRRFKIPWTCLTTVTSITKDLLREMKSAGCWQVLFGLESGDERMLSLLKKGTTLEQNMNAVSWAKEAGLSVRADFIVGTPGETEGSLKKTLDFALNMKMDYAHFNKFVPYPGTGLYKSLSKDGFDFDFIRGSSITDHTSFLYIPESIRNKDRYKVFVNYAHRKFYLRAGYIFKRLLSIKTMEELKAQIRGFISIALLR